MSRLGLTRAEWPGSAGYVFARPQHVPSQRPGPGWTFNSGHGLAQGLRGVWLHSEGGGTTIKNYLGRLDGVFVGSPAPTWAVSGFDGPGVSIASSTDYVDTTNGVATGVLADTDAFTIAVRVYPTNTTNDLMGVARGDQTNNTWSIFSGLFTNAGNLGTRLNVADSGGTAHAIQGSQVLSLNTWYTQYGVWIPGTGTRNYTNGILDGTLSWVTTTLRSSTLGVTWPGKTTVTRAGVIAWVFIWNRPLNDREIQDHYTRPYSMFSYQGR